MDALTDVMSQAVEAINEQTIDPMLLALPKPEIHSVKDLVEFCEKAAFHFEMMGSNILNMATSRNAQCQLVAKTIREVMEVHTKEIQITINRLTAAGGELDKMMEMVNGKKAA